VNPALGVNRKLLGRPVGGHGLLLGGVAGGDPLGQFDSISVITERGQATHGQCEKHDR
jgi:hypothetical protein